MRKSTAVAVTTLLVSSALFGCGGSSPAAPAAPSAANAPSVESAAPTPPPDATAAPSTEEAPAAAAPTKAPAGSVSEEKIRASKALDEPFPKIEDVTKEIGAPFAKGKATRRGWRFEKKPSGKTFSCSTIDLIRGPSGRVTFDRSVYTSDDCKQVANTEAQVQGVLSTLSGTPASPLDIMMGEVKKPFEEASALFEKKLGKPSEAGEPEFAAWRYADDGGQCRVVLVTSHLGSKAGQALWGLPCD